ncbi:MAG: hypothetical protein QXX79_02290 [Candidatus Bathyarchaeia archaeon]
MPLYHLHELSTNLIAIVKAIFQTMLFLAMRKLKTFCDNGHRIENIASKEVENFVRV